MVCTAHECLYACTHACVNKHICVPLHMYTNVLEDIRVPCHVHIHVCVSSKCMLCISAFEHVDTCEYALVFYAMHECLCVAYIYV